MVPRQTISRENTRVELHAQIQHAGVHRTHFFILSKTLLNNAIREPETIRVKQTRPQERWSIEDIVFFGLDKFQNETGSICKRIEATHPFIQLGNLDCDLLRLFVPLQLVQPNLFLDDLSKKEREEFFVIFWLSEIFPETLEFRCTLGDLATQFSYHAKKDTYPLQRLLDAHLLRTNEASNRNRNRQVNIIRADIFPEMHLRTCFRHANHAL